MEFPKQEHRGGNSQRATVALRDLVTLYKDAAKGGDTNPDYTCVIAEDVPAEVLQVAGGEVVRGIQVEGITTLVVTIHWLETLGINSQCEVLVGSGDYVGCRLFAHRVHIERARGRPRQMQLHCKMKDE